MKFIIKLRRRSCHRRSKYAWSNCVLFIPFILSGSPHKSGRNLVPGAHVSFGQRQDTELWNNQFPELSWLATRFIKLLMSKLPEVKILVNKIRTAEWTPTKLVNMKICRCCCKPLGSNDCPFHFSAKSPKWKWSWKDTMKLLVSKEMKMMDCQFVCWSWPLKIATFQEFKTLCRECDSKQRA